MTYRNLLFSLLLASVWHLAKAQTTTLQVVTKSTTKVFEYAAGSEVNIEGQHAEIVVESWTQNKVRVEVRIIAKHTDVHQAEKDLETMQLSIKQEGSKLYFRNYLKSGEKPSAQLKVQYTVSLPADCPVYVKNNYGSLRADDLTKRLRTQLRFTDIQLTNLSGYMAIDTYFGDLLADGLSGEVNINSKRSDLTLHNISGDFTINAQYGLIKLFTDQSELKLDITAEKADVYFFDPEPGIYGYTLTAHYGNISTPNELKFNFIENSGKLKRAIFTPANKMATISVKITFGDIVIRRP
ncbi:MAG TPA: hypothetical protein ENJ88_04600 [Phaeodactylibacter sp.]|nr:hypothetical protein [Phaeodactylibacter sp.]